MEYAKMKMQMYHEEVTNELKGTAMKLEVLMALEFKLSILR